MISSAARRAINRVSIATRYARSIRLVTSTLGPLRRFPLQCSARLPYTTERVVEFRSGRRSTPTLYDGSRETENCGVGLVASLKSIASRRVVEDADEMLVRMSHRGGCGCDPASGDGAGEV
jgi:Glutamine amidotransferases class-II